MKPETWSDEVGFGSIVRRQIRVVADAMGDSLTQRQVSELSLRVQGLRSLLKPYTAEEGQEAIAGIMEGYKEKEDQGDGERLVVLRYHRALKVFEALLEVAKKAGFLKE